MHFTYLTSVDYINTGYRNVSFLPSETIYNSSSEGESLRYIRYITAYSYIHSLLTRYVF
jgi:hypothetical protein